MSAPASLWTVSQANPKTGPVPVQYVGKTREETRASCDGCNLAPWADGGCWYWGGNSRRAHGGVIRSAKAKDLASVLERTPRAARVARFGGGGDPGRVELATTLTELDQVEAAGLRPIGYTHHWRERPALRAHFLASVETLADAAEAEEAGWAVALAGPTDPPATYARCVNERAPWITCNTCGLCNPQELARRGLRGVTFAAHGSGAKRLPLAGARLS